VAKKLKVDFSGVDKEIKKGSGRAAKVPEGDYLVKIVGHEVRTTKDKKSKYISWKNQIVEPKKFKGKTLYGTTSLKPEALWSLRNLIHAALGKNVAGKAVEFDPEKIYGKVVGASVEDNEYTKDGTTKVTSQVSTWFPKEEYEEGTEEEEEEEDDDDEEEEEEDDDEDLEEVDVDEL
jgi:TATA-binding protein-associated factor Taf7